MRLSEWTPKLTHASIGALYLLLVGFSIGYGFWDYEQSGSLWPDSPRYANAGCMIADAWDAGALHDLENFATQNYAQYPAFSVPYHPPGYPISLGIWFQAFGRSYFTARLFSVLCWIVTGLLVTEVNRELGLSRAQALLSALFVLTTPQLAVWSRDLMSEIPSMPLILGAAWAWLVWLRQDRWYWCLLSWLLIVLAFFTRLSTSGVLPGLLMYTLLTLGFQRRWLIYSGIGTLSYLTLGIFWVRFVHQYASHEAVADGKGSQFLLSAWDYFTHCLPGILASGSAALALLFGLITRTKLFTIPSARFWLCWLGSMILFKVIMATSLEVRHFYLGIFAFAGIGVAALSNTLGPVRIGKTILILAAIACNLLLCGLVPAGLVGYRPVASVLAHYPEPGNILLACWEDQDLIFHYRVQTTRTDRYCVRSDRTLAIRVSDYAKVEAKLLAQSEVDVLNLVKRGRLALIVSCTSAPERGDDFRTPEMQLVHATMLNHPEQFERLGQFPLTVDYVEKAHATSGGTIHVWRNRFPVEAGPPNLSIVIPTAGLVIQP